MNISTEEIKMNSNLLLKTPITKMQAIDNEIYTFNIINRYFLLVFKNKTMITLNDISLFLNSLQNEHIHIYNKKKVNIKYVNSLTINDIVNVYTYHSMI